MTTVISKDGLPPIRGRLSVPGDKSIAHRALLLGALAEGATVIRGFPGSEDCLATMRCLRALGAQIDHDVRAAGQPISILGRGPASLREPEDVLDTSNSGTAMRLLAGLIAGLGHYAVLTGDESLRRRPMQRVIEPLARMGATLLARSDGRYPPLTVRGARLRGIDYTLPIPSAQVKSAILLAGLMAEGETLVREPQSTRDHTERMLKAMGADLSREEQTVRLRGGSGLLGRSIEVPGDISSAAFFLVAATIVPGSEIVIEGVGVNPTRTGVLDVLSAMGADIVMENVREAAGEPIADLRARSSQLRGTSIAGDIIPRVIDELPILAVAATQAVGRTEVRDAGELRVKETDRITAVAAELCRLGARVQESADGFVVEGPSHLRGTHCRSYGDHRIAMALAIADLVAEGDVTVEGRECVGVSFPRFYEVLSRLQEEG